MKNDVKRITDAIGTERLCEALGVKPSSIEKARSNGVMPASWFDAVNAMCWVMSVDCPRGMFAWKRPK